MLSIDIQYLQTLPLKLFGQTDSNKWKFRCPVCGDSEKNAKLKRGNAQIWDGSLFIKCFNCDYSKPFSFFIRTEFPEHFKSYRLDILRSKNYTNKTIKTKPEEIIRHEYTKIDLLSIAELPQDHIAVKEVTRRRIPAMFYDLLYYTDNFGKWFNTIKSGTFKTLRKSDKRLVIPFFDRFNRLIGVQGRTLENGFPKYLTVKLNVTDEILFGMDRIDDSKMIYVTEGPIDSMFLDNAIATCTSISKFELLKSIAPVERFVLVYDNEKRNGATSDFIEKALKQGFKVVIWQKDILEKDLNDMILKKDLTKEDLCAIIDENVYTGKTGLIKLKFWRK